MIKEGIVRFKPVTIDWCEKESILPNCPMAVMPNNEIVFITAFDKTNNIVMVQTENSQLISISLGLSVFVSGNLFYLIIEEVDELFTFVGSKEYSIESNLWKFILDKNLQNVRIEFDDSKERVEKITLFEPPPAPVFTTVFRIIAYPQTLYMNDYIKGHLNEEYSTYEEAQNQIPEMSKNIPYDYLNGVQVYFQIEKFFKRKEYERKQLKN